MKAVVKRLVEGNLNVEIKVDSMDPARPGKAGAQGKGVHLDLGHTVKSQGDTRDSEFE
jgi:hypothetical protein